MKCGQAKTIEKEGASADFQRPKPQRLHQPIGFPILAVLGEEQWVQFGVW